MKRLNWPACCKQARPKADVNLEATFACAHHLSLLYRVEEMQPVGSPTVFTCQLNSWGQKKDRPVLLPACRPDILTHKLSSLHMKNASQLQETAMYNWFKWGALLWQTCRALCKYKKCRARRKVFLPWPDIGSDKTTHIAMIENLRRLDPFHAPLVKWATADERGLWTQALMSKFLEDLVCTSELYSMTGYLPSRMWERWWCFSSISFKLICSL